MLQQADEAREKQLRQLSKEAIGKESSLRKLELELECKKRKLHLEQEITRQKLDQERSWLKVVWGGKPIKMQ